MNLRKEAQLGEVKKNYGSGPRAHDFCLAHGTFFYFQFCIFLFIPLEKNNFYEENKNEKSQPCILGIPYLGLGM